MNKIFFLVFIFIIQSCEWISPSRKEQKDILAKVGSSVLYENDIIYNPLLGDSAKVFSQQVDMWIKKQLVLSVAFQNQDIINEIEKKITSYKENLIMFEFQKYIYLNSYYEQISDDEIVQYYRDNINDFILPFNLVKTLYAKIPNDAPSINSFRNNFRKFPNADTTEIISYCFQFAEKSYLEDSTWIKFDDILLNVPFPAETNKTNFLKSRSFYEIRDDNYIYFMKILDKKLIGDFSPISFEKEIINTILLNNRKQDLFNNLRDSIFNNSVKGVDYEVFN